MSHTTEVIVYMNGKPSSGHEVSLEFAGYGGFTDKFMTNSSGVARVRHESSGHVYVYVDGDHSGHGTTDQAPGRIYVYL